MSDDKFRSLGPVRVREVDRAHKILVAGLQGANSRLQTVQVLATSGIEHGEGFVLQPRR
jgi:hypothetical protein